MQVTIHLGLLLRMPSHIWRIGGHRSVFIRFTYFCEPGKRAFLNACR